MSNISQLDKTTQFLPSLGEIEIPSSPAAKFSNIVVELTINDNIFCETYNSGFKTSVFIDIKDLIQPNMFHSLPDLHGNFKPQAGLKVGCGFTQPSAVSFDILGMRDASKNTISAIDQLRVPLNYIIPLNCYNVESNSLSGLVDANGKIIASYHAPDCSTLPAVAFLITSYIEGPFSTFRTGSNSVRILGPTLIPSAGKFEQYLFANEFGGFDNVPMDGVLEYVPSHSFDNDTIAGSLKRASSKIDNLYRQNSGFQTQATIKALSSLMHSRQIWHFKDGQWKQIVIESVDISVKSTAAVHSMTFEYKYIN